jgi:hypothetical protein
VSGSAAKASKGLANIKAKTVIQIHSLYLYLDAFIIVLISSPLKLLPIVFASMTF